MKTSNNAFSLLEQKLRQIETTAVEGILQKNARNCCMEIKNLVHETRQVIYNEFYATEEPSHGA